MPKTITFNKMPSVFNYMLMALWPSAGLRKTGLTEINIDVCNYKINVKEANCLFKICGIEKSETLPIFFPQILAFKLVMRTVTDITFPEPIWKALQIRNKIVQHQPIRSSDSLKFTMKTGELRIMEKGAEIDLHLSACKEDSTLWESCTTFYYRGRHGNPSAKEEPLRPPQLTSGEVFHFTLPKRQRFSFSKISGDFNGIHLWDWYARLFNFKKAFLHPHRVLGQIFSNLPHLKTSDIKEMEIWFKGPVSYGAKVSVVSNKMEAGQTFALFETDDQRPKIIGRVSTGAVPKT